jgi:hypothetical protein
MRLRLWMLRQRARQYFGRHSIDAAQAMAAFFAAHPLRRVAG